LARDGKRLGSAEARRTYLAGDGVLSIGKIEGRGVRSKKFPQKTV
jgi:hypothetical protein